MSKNSIFFIILFLSFACHSFAQENIIAGTTPFLHLQHKVASKETWYSISRNYNITAKDLAAYNKLSLKKPLGIGDAINIPLTDANFVQDDKKPAGEKLVPLYHVVQEKEWMYRISVNHNKVPIERIEKWNAITKDQARPGMKIIVGFLKTPNENAGLAAVDNEEKKPAAKVEEVKAEEPKKEPLKPAATEKNSNPVAEVKEVKESSGQKGGGYFKIMFDGNGKNSSGISGIFKSTSGWNDGKYYALMNNVPVGTIIEVVFPQTNKSVYAKVLGELPEMKESAGLALRISDAAANELGASESKFSVDVKY